MLVDHERAWHLFTQYVASKPHHGSTALLAEMQRILSLPDVVVNEETPERMLRLYGVHAQIELRRNLAEGSNVAGGSPADAVALSTDHELTLGGHDGSSSDSSTAAAARTGRADHEGSARPRGRSAAGRAAVSG